MYQRKPNSNRNVVKNYSQDPSYNGRRGTVQLLNNNTNKDEEEKSNITQFAFQFACNLLAKYSAYKASQPLV